MESDNISALYNSLGKKYLEEIEPATPPEITDFMALLPKGASVLEVGCAGGRDSQKFIDSEFRVVGTDISDVFLEEASKRLPSASFKHMDARSLDFPNDQFDAIWANAVLLHLPKHDIPTALKEFHRVLKPGGKLHIRVKEGEESKEVAEELSQGKTRSFTLFGQKEMETFIQDAGFTILASERVPDDLGRTHVIWLKIWAQK